MLPDGTYRQSASLRWLRTIGYALIGLSGVLLLLSPIFPPDVGPTGIVMAWFLVFGGLFACAGAGTTRWFGEFIGLPLLVSAFLVFALLTLEDFDEIPYIVSANVALLIGLSLLLTARWRYVLAVFHLADRFSRKGKARE
jgi:hypothetical membrane protein